MEKTGRRRILGLCSSSANGLVAIVDDGSNGRWLKGRENDKEGEEKYIVQE